MIRRRKHGILSAMLAASLALTSMTTVLAAAPVPTDDEAIALLQSYGLVKGDEFGNLNLEKQITRAEAATIFVRALGQESTVPLMASLVPFDDAKGHWAAGYIAVAYRLNVMKGRSETVFDPDALITNQEVYTVLLRLVQREPLGAWNPQQIMQISADLGLTPTGIHPGVLGPANALRGTIFRSLGKAVTSLPLADGRTVLGTYVDFLPPTLRLEAPPNAVGTSSVRLTGTAQGAAYILVGDQKVALGNGDRFTVDVPLTPGSNSFEITAVDWAGNSTSQTISVIRAGDAASIVVVGEISVKAGQSVPLQAVAYDANKIALPTTALTATVSNNLGSYNAANGTFTASNNVGAGTITFKAGSVTQEVPLTVLGVAQQARRLRIKDADQVVATIGKVSTVTVEVLDNEGNLVTYDDGRTISLTATGLTGLSVLSATTTTQKGIATFSVSGSQAGTATLTASANGLTAATGSLSVASSTRILLSTVATNPVADGNTPVIIRGQLVNEKGEPVANTTGNDIRINIDTNSNTTTASSNLLVIPRGRFSSEGNDAALTPGLISETVGVSGRITSSGHNYTVVGTSMRLTELKIGSPARMEIVSTGTVRSPGQSANLVVRVLDSNGNVVPTGSYGFQISATTTNGETVLPYDAEITVNGYSIEKGQTGAMVARTKNGTASVVLTYPKSGRVNLKVVPASATNQAVDSNGEFDSTSNASGLQAGEVSILYSANPDHAVLKWDIGTLKDQDNAVLLGNGSAVAKLKVYVYDKDNGMIANMGGTATIKNKKTDNLNGDVSRASSATATIKDGVAEFTITSKNVLADGTDTWEVTVTPSTGKTLTVVSKDVRVVKEKLGKPQIDTMQGDSGIPNRLLAGDEHLQITFFPYPGSYGSVKLYRSNGSLLWTSPIINLGNGSVQVPRSVLQASDRYAIKVDNGAGESPISDYWPNSSSDRVVKEEGLEIDITGATYNAAADGGTLTIKANTSLSGGRLDPLYLAVYNAATNSRTFLSEATSCTISSSSIICKGLYLDAKDFHGNVVMETESGWWTNDSTGKTATVDRKTENNTVGPMAYLTGATISYTFGSDPSKPPTGASVTLTGVNLNNRIDLRKLSIEGIVLGNTTISNSNSTTATFTVQSSSVAKLYTDAVGSSSLDAETGWLTSSSDQNAEVLGVGIYADIELRSLTYDKKNHQMVIKLMRDVTSKPSDVDLTKIVYRKTSSATFDPLKVENADIKVNGDTITITWPSAPAFEKAGTDFVFTTRPGWLTEDGWQVKGSTKNFRVQL